MTSSYTTSESNNLEEFQSDADPNSLPLRYPLTSGVVGLTHNLIITPTPTKLIQPAGLQFLSTGMSNGISSRFNGINDFNAYCDFISHDNRRYNTMSDAIRSTTNFYRYGR